MIVSQKVTAGSLVCYWRLYLKQVSWRSFPHSGIIVGEFGSQGISGVYTGLAQECPHICPADRGLTGILDKTLENGSEIDA